MCSSRRSLVLLLGVTLVTSGAASATEPTVKGPSIGEQVMKQVNLCRVVEGFVGAPCVGKILGEKILPYLVPISVEGLQASQTIIDLDHGVWGKAVDWVNGGLDWLGVKKRYQMPKKIGYNFGLSLSLEDFKLEFPATGAREVEFDALLAGHMKVLSQGLFNGMKFDPKVRVKGKVYVTTVPYGEDCKKKKGDFSMVVLNIELTRVDIKKFPDFIDGSKMFLAIVNWGLSKAYDDYPEYKTRGIAVCLAGNCPAPKGAKKEKKKEKEGEGVLKFGKMHVESKYFSVRNETPRLVIKDHSFLCGIVSGVVNSGCTDAFVNHMANTVMPVSLPVPEIYGVKGLSVSADKFSTEIDKKDHVDMTLAASLHKEGKGESFGVTLGAGVDIVPQCTKDSFMVTLRPRVNGVKMTPIPQWILDEVNRLAVAVNLPHFDFCPEQIAVVGKKLDLCALTDDLLKEKCTGPFVSTVADAVFPVTARPADFAHMQTYVTDQKLLKLLKGITVSVDKLGVEIPKPGESRDVNVSVKASIKKDGESKSFSASAKAGFHIGMKCGKSKSAIRITPSILGVDVSKVIPQWLIDLTLVGVTNIVLSKSTFAICAIGNCKDKQKIDIALPIDTKKTAKKAETPAKAPACNFDSFVGGN